MEKLDYTTCDSEKTHRGIDYSQMTKKEDENQILQTKTLVLDDLRKALINLTENDILYLLYNSNKVKMEERSDIE